VGSSAAPGVPGARRSDFVLRPVNEPHHQARRAIRSRPPGRGAGGGATTRSLGPAIARDLASMRAGVLNRRPRRLERPTSAAKAAAARDHHQQLEAGFAPRTSWIKQAKKRHRKAKARSTGASGQGRDRSRCRQPAIHTGEGGTFGGLADSPAGNKGRIDGTRAERSPESSAIAPQGDQARLADRWRTGKAWRTTFRAGRWLIAESRWGER